MTRSELATPTATIETLKRFGLYTKKSLGQHFLVDNNVIERTIALADIAPTDIVLEVGPGIGTLTVALIEVSESVVAVERDDDLLKVLRSTTGAAPNFSLLSADATTVTPDDVAAPFGAPVKLVANLPYQVAATIVLRTFEQFPSVRSVTVMVQAEVADRMAARPGSKSYGAYTVKLNLLAREQGRFAVARNSFLPPPRVDSSVIRLDALPVDEQLVRSSEHYAEVARVVDAAFAQRRKTIRNSLTSSLALPAARVEEALIAAGIDPAARAETLPVELFITLTEKLQELT